MKQLMIRRRDVLYTLLLLTALPHLALAQPDGTTENKEARGAFTCDFALPASFPASQIGPAIERDRMYQSARPGMLHKHIPINFDPTTGNILSGGRYLFDTIEHANDYKDWVFNSYILDGVLFLHRPYFLNPECHAWAVIDAHDFGDIHTSQVVLRTERWMVTGNQEDVLKERFDAILAEADRRAITSVWLLYDKDEALVSLVYFGGRVAPNSSAVPDFASLGALAGAPPLGAIFDDRGWTRSFDRTEWTLTIWFPFVLGDHGEPSLWPNSPPIPQPYSGDGVCEVSRGETFANSPDCLPTCGNGIADPGETSMNCPGDVRLFPGDSQLAQRATPY
ncbi:MAG TPA: hypothetical protein VNX70_18420 [Bryobacteraceae bacterium]|nr:hypothetical protein [Bryobacteraceae bacterium]